MKKIPDIDNFVLLSTLKMLPTDDEGYKSWNVFDSPWALENFWSCLEYLEDIVDGKKKLAFDIENDLMHEEILNYPVFVCGKNIFKAMFEDEEDDLIPSFEIAKNKEELEEIKNSFDEVNYIFSLKDDLYADAMEYIKKQEFDFEKKIMTPVEMKGTILITDPCYLLDKTPDDYSPYDLTSIGLSTFISRNTLYGDWSCHTFTPDGKVLGAFCADSGMVCVCLYDEVLKINPEFETWLSKHSHAATVIENFDGVVKFVIDSDELSVNGTGNIEFYTRQTGF